ncbi:MAG: VOC family protein, partial [Candidatus Heimdallarchaeota archaeon]
IETDDLEALVEHMKSKGYEFRKPIKSLGVLKYAMAEAPDHVLLELFEVVKDKLPEDQYKIISAL